IHSITFDKKKEKFLLIRKHTIQVWHNQGPEKNLLNSFMYLYPSINEQISIK
ncbi:46430_t:CDS:1, partial [Gigaspora margarita]